MAIQAFKGPMQAQHRAACRMRIAGKPNSYIAKELGVKERTLHIWFSDQRVKDYLAELAENVESEFVQELARSSFIALEELTDMVQVGVNASDMTPHTKMEVAREILDRNPALAKLRDRAQAAMAAGQGGAGAMGGNVTNYLTVFQSMPDADLVEFLTTWRDTAGTNGSQPVIEGKASRGDSGD